MLPRHGLGTVAKAASRVVTWLLTGSLVLFTGYLTLSGAVSTSADALTVQVTRSAVGAMPVVGRILSDAAGSVLAGAGVVKNAIGVFGLLGVLAACLGPFVRLGVQYLFVQADGVSGGDDRRSGAGEAHRCAGWRVRPDAGYDRQLRPAAAHLHLLGHSGGDTMMETLRGWLLGLTAAALAVSLLTAMLPKGRPSAASPGWRED